MALDSLWLAAAIDWEAVVLAGLAGAVIWYMDKKK